MLRLVSFSDIALYVIKQEESTGCVKTTFSDIALYVIKQEESTGCVKTTFSDIALYVIKQECDIMLCVTEQISVISL